MTDSECAALAAEYLALDFRAGTRWDQAMASHRANDIHRLLAEEFGRRRGWKRTRRGFAFGQLGRRSNQRTRDEHGGYLGDNISTHDVADHPYFYRETVKPYRPAALAAHLYGIQHHRRDIAVVCARFALTATEVTDYPSWWFPGQTQLVVYEPLTSQIQREATAA